MNAKDRYPWLGEEPSFEENGINEIVETDVVVCGAGVAGVAAARSAVESGSECVLFEKCGGAQGRSGQFAVLGGRFMERWYQDTEKMIPEISARLMYDSGYRAKQRLLNYALHHIGEDFDWYLDGLPKDGLFIAHDTADPSPEGTKLRCMLMRYPPQESYNPSSEACPVYPFTVQFMPGHLGILKRNLQLAMETGRLKTFFKTPAKRLLRDSGGRVTGVIAQGYDGKTVKAIARSGVVLATGDYSGDQRMLEWYFPEVANNPHIPCGIAPDKTMANSGDGHKMGMWAGAKMEDGPHCINNHNMGGAMGVTPYLQLDMDGRRFMNEDATGQKLENQLHLLKGNASWQLFDGAWPEQISHMPVGHGACSHLLDEKAVAEGLAFGELNPMDSYASQEYINKCIERGDTVKADSLETLIELAGLPQDPAMSSIRRYNELARKGCDEDFGKRASRMFPLEKPPFYASKIGVAPVLCCHSGLESDEEGRCLDTEGEPIPGLFVAGNVQGNRFVSDYPTTLPGFSHSIALSFGRLAGRNAANRFN